MTKTRKKTSGNYKKNQTKTILTLQLTAESDFKVNLCHVFYLSADVSPPMRFALYTVDQPVFPVKSLTLSGFLFQSVWMRLHVCPSQSLLWWLTKAVICCCPGLLISLLWIFLLCDLVDFQQQRQIFTELQWIEWHHQRLCTCQLL